MHVWAIRLGAYASSSLEGIDKLVSVDTQHELAAVFREKVGRAD